MKKKTDIPALHASDCVRALAKAFPAPQYAFFEQVANGTGSRQDRWADAVAMGIWPSRGLLIHGFEIKVERRDWLNELKNPAKSEPVQKFCDRWWIVTPKGLVTPTELPPTWGLIELDAAHRCHYAVTAPELQPEPLTRSFVAAVLRRANEHLNEILVRERHVAREEGAKNGAGELAARLDAAIRRAEDIEKRIEEFEKLSGIGIFHWDLGNIAKAVKALTDNMHRMNAMKVLENEQALYERSLARVKEEIAALQAAEEKAAE